MGGQLAKNLNSSQTELLWWSNSLMFKPPRAQQLMKQCRASRLRQAHFKTSQLADLDQESAETVLEGRSPAEFSSNPNQTHLKRLIKLLRGIPETFREVCWGKLEVNSAGHRPSTTADLDYFQICVFLALMFLKAVLLYSVLTVLNSIHVMWNKTESVLKG